MKNPFFPASDPLLCLTNRASECPLHLWWLESRPICGLKGCDSEGQRNAQLRSQPLLQQRENDSKLQQTKNSCCKRAIRSSGYPFEAQESQQPPTPAEVATCPQPNGSPTTCYRRPRDSALLLVRDETRVQVKQLSRERVAGLLAIG